MPWRPKGNKAFVLKHHARPLSQTIMMMNKDSHVTEQLDG